LGESRRDSNHDQSGVAKVKSLRAKAAQKQMAKAKEEYNHFAMLDAAQVKLPAHLLV
jgi:hypothetical protein